MRPVFPWVSFHRGFSQPPGFLKVRMSGSRCDREPESTGIIGSVGQQIGDEAPKKKEKHCRYDNKSANRFPELVQLRRHVGPNFRCCFFRIRARIKIFRQSRTWMFKNAQRFLRLVLSYEETDRNGDRRSAQIVRSFVGQLTFDPSIVQEGFYEA